MIAKVITLKYGSGSKGFDPVMSYIMRAGHESGLAQEVRIEAGHINVADEELYFGPDDERAPYASDLACVFNGVDFKCRRKGRFNGNPVYHVAINWQEGEHPTPEQAAYTCNYVMKELGYAEHQAAWAIHRDTDNDHVHLVINRVHPESLKAICPPFKKEFLILDRCMRELEIKFGQKRANGPYVTLETKDGGQQIVRMSRAERRERGLLKEDNKPPLTRGAAAAEHRLGNESFQTWVAIAPAADIKQVIAQPGASWQDVHDALLRHGVVIQPKGSGMVVTTTLAYGRVLAAKASQMGRWASRTELEKKFGQFVPSSQPVVLSNVYQQQLEARRKEEQSVKSSDADRSPARDSDERMLKREARAQAREALAGRFKAEQESIRENTASVRETLRDRHQDERRELTQQHQKERSDARATAKQRGQSVELALSVWAFKAAREREELQKRQAVERRDLTTKTTRAEVWRKWLESQAAQGDEASLAALRGIRYREQRAKNEAINGIDGDEVDPLRRHTLADLDALIDRRRQMVVYRGKDGKDRFTDTGPRIVMMDKADDSLEAALRLAAQKYGGKISITGSSEFRERATRQAVRLGIKVVNEDLKAVVKDEQEKQHVGIFNKKEFHNERPDYERINLKRAKSGQLSAAVYQSNIAPVGAEAPSQSVTSVRNLSSLDLVHHQPAQMFLQTNAPDRMGLERTADSEVRRSGDSPVGDGAGLKLSTESVDNSSDKQKESISKSPLTPMPKKSSKRHLSENMER